MIHLNPILDKQLLAILHPLITVHNTLPNCGIGCQLKRQAAQLIHLNLVTLVDLEVPGVFSQQVELIAEFLTEDVS
jgi:hypothetical protein